MQYLPTTLQERIWKSLSTRAPSPIPPRFTTVAGGSINQTFRVDTGSQTFFCKRNDSARFPKLFEKEEAGLSLLATNGPLRTPRVLDCFETDGHQVLLLEWIVEGTRGETFWKRFGEGLAGLHQNTGNFFGLDVDNYMGSVPQQNHKAASWCEFFREQRLQPLVKRCVGKGLLDAANDRLFDNLYRKLESVFEATKPSLLHGDLWSGNFLCDEKREPVLIDPAVYYGHPSVDLAMTTLFGGFHPLFYEAYQHHTPFPANFREQWDVCNLYPLLVHLYLFGRSYLPQIEGTLNRFG